MILPPALVNEAVKSKITILTAALMALFAAQPRAAKADDILGILFRGDPRVVASGVAVGAASTAAYFAIAPRHHHHLRYGFTRTGAMAATTVGCIAVAPIVAAAWVDATEHRELTSREALGLVGGCVVPVLGGVFWEAAFDAHPEWERRPVRAKH